MLKWPGATRSEGIANKEHRYVPLNERRERIHVVLRHVGQLRIVAMLYSAFPKMSKDAMLTVYEEGAQESSWMVVTELG